MQIFLERFKEIQIDPKELKLLDLADFDAITFEEGVDGGFTLTETDIQVHCTLSTTLLQDVLTETFCSFLIKDRTVLSLRLFED